MHIILAAFLAGPTLLPQIDRRSLELQARAESLQPRAIRARNAVATSNGGGLTLDLGSITTICRAAGGQSDPAAFLSRLSAAYSLSHQERAALRASCAAYLQGRADAGRRAADTY